MGFPELWLVKEVARKKKITLQKALRFILRDHNKSLDKKHQTKCSHLGCVIVPANGCRKEVL